MAGDIESSRLRHRVRFMSPHYSKDEYGQDVIDWVDQGLHYAEIVGNGGGTSLSIGRSSITYNHTIRIRYSSRVASITAAWRVEWKARVFEISSVLLDEFNSILTIECAEENPATEYTGV